jgi:hypothetical protein
MGALTTLTNAAAMVGGWVQAAFSGAAGLSDENFAGLDTTEPDALNQLRADPLRTGAADDLHVTTVRNFHGLLNDYDGDALGAASFESSFDN